jgi:tetratricopeptide (TPR) repeat protein
MVDGELEKERGRLADGGGYGAHALNMLEVCESMWAEALAMRRRALPEDHPDIATSLNNLAKLYNGQRRYEEAEPMYVEALEIKRRTLPEGHPSIATSLNNLAALYDEQNRYEEAEAMMVEALAMERRALPEGHPDIARSLWNLALMYETMKQYEKSLPMVEEAHAILLAAHGPEHERTRMVVEKIEELRQLIGEEAGSA